MEENEVIIVDSIPTLEYERVIKEAIEYAIISLPFTINRMGLCKFQGRIINIAKGKISEGLFHYFCHRNNITLNTTDCVTPFYQPDKRDFVLQGSEWDIKNNYIYHVGGILSFNYTDLPALIPNRSAQDQWSKREIKYIPSSVDTRFLFTFMKAGDLKNGRRGKSFLEITLTAEQNNFLFSLIQVYKGIKQQAQPFSENWFWDEMIKFGNGTLFHYSVSFYPSLIITGYAGSKQWNLFEDQPPQSFFGNTLRTRIINRQCSISKLQSFLSVFPRLREQMTCGRVKT